MTKKKQVLDSNLSTLTDHIISEAEKFELERKIIKEQILNDGISFNISRLSFWDFPKYELLKFMKNVKGRNKRGLRIRKINIVKPYLSTMDHLAGVKLQLQVNMQKLDENPIHHKNLVVKDNADLMCKIISYSLLNNDKMIRKYGDYLAKYISERIDSQILSDIIGAINILEDAANFINSTVLMSGTKRTTEPKAE